MVKININNEREFNELIELVEKIHSALYPEQEITNMDNFEKGWIDKFKKTNIESDLPEIIEMGHSFFMDVYSDALVKFELESYKYLRKSKTSNDVMHICPCQGMYTIKDQKKHFQTFQHCRHAYNQLPKEVLDGVFPVE